jgi:2-polyprenyl-3-methyl-5-hydroxy-6-metoxy-1,4-benzoquinol methylase
MDIRGIRLDIVKREWQASEDMSINYMMFFKKGTHEWIKFLKPSEISDVLTACDLELIDIRGIKLDIIKRE